MLCRRVARYDRVVMVCIKASRHHSMGAWMGGAAFAAEG